MGPSCYGRRRQRMLLALKVPHRVAEHLSGAIDGASDTSRAWVSPVCQLVHCTGVSLTSQSLTLFRVEVIRP